MANYPEMLVAPMRKQLTDNGFTELLSAEQVSEVITNNEDSALVVVNSVCGCAAGTARPGVLLSLQNEKTPAQLLTVFAGMELDAVAKAREFMLPYPPSSPAVALFKGGKLVYMLERHQIEGRTAMMIANDLAAAYNSFC